AFPNLLLRNHNSLCSLALGFEPQHVFPCFCSFSRLRQLYGDLHFRILTCVQATQFADATPICHRGLQSTPAGLADVTQETKDIQQVRLSGCVWAKQERDLLEGKVEFPEVAPVLEL